MKWSSPASAIIQRRRRNPARVRAATAESRPSIPSPTSRAPSAPRRSRAVHRGSHKFDGASVVIPSWLPSRFLCGVNRVSCHDPWVKPTFRGSPTVSLTTFFSFDEFQRASGGGVVGGWSTSVRFGFARGRRRFRFPFHWPRISRWCHWVLLRPNTVDPLRHLRQFLASLAGSMSWTKSWG
ncbi:hypothetical protein TIFTF001_006207 [Ficus carica]|uniref:Uncharacterized protein n=1 Tax=Ficus carica TaxID=3494 RepID=A0AA87ZNR6_FICCA|nr:hypothetical protein TIFTF001_006207 [Ficus carica]